MSGLLFSPLTNSEVYDRDDSAANLLAHAARDGEWEPDHYFHEHWLEKVATSKLTHAAVKQRIYR